MFLFFSILAVLSLAISALMPLYLKKSGEYRVLFFLEAALSLLGCLGAGVTAIVLHAVCRKVPNAEYGSWAEDLFLVYAGILAIPAAVILGVVLLTALLSPGKLRLIRAALPPLAGAVLLLVASVLSHTAVNDGSIAVDRYLLVFALFLSLLFHLRGTLENGMRWRFLARTDSLVGISPKKKKHRKKKR